MTFLTHHEKALQNLRDRLRPLVIERNKLELKSGKTQEDLALIEEHRLAINKLRKEERKLSKIVKGVY